MSQNHSLHALIPIDQQRALYCDYISALLRDADVCSGSMAKKLVPGWT